MVSICTWNIRGLNDPSKVTEVKKLLHTYNIKVMAILETRVKSRKSQVIMDKFGSKWCWANNYSCSDKGRIWLGWNPDSVSLTIEQVDEQFIHCSVPNIHGDFEFFFTAIYGLHTIDTRRALWRELGNVNSKVGSWPWMLSGDFNTILAVQDRINGTAVTLAEIKDFGEFVDKYVLTELKSTGHVFSWHKGGDGTKTTSRIDRCLGNVEWMDKKSLVCTEYLNAGISDHCPVLINCLADDNKGGRPFKIFNYLVDHPDFMDIVEQCWKETPPGNVMFSVWHRFKLIRHKLKLLHCKEFKGIQEKIDQSRLELDGIQDQLKLLPSDGPLLIMEQTCSIKLRKWLEIEDTTLKQKARLQWLHNGDSNNKFFFAAVKERHRINRISSLYDVNDNKLVKPSDIQKWVSLPCSLSGSFLASLLSLIVFYLMASLVFLFLLKRA
ncbi:uncharacterized protein [Spinacia oleracea]|uniref:Endonuclease/exonuclease/phosphatase domain-containing protein n=1 Tax=Spinacia oleracea TaxID=3562 RepID=A0ABM3QYX7_SPIOL|nr:uncharacterized protein LOC110788743 [Spinacia oleracea]